MAPKFFKKNAFTLIELLVVIAIIAILSIVVVLVLNPAQLLQQSRDSSRVADMADLSNALGIYQAQGGNALGSNNTVYVSLPDPLATSTAGDQCQGLGLPSLPSTYTYQCTSAANFRNVNGTGWIPVNFTSIPDGSPFGQLPVDPTNTSSSRLYYTYDTNGSQYEVTSVMESSKYGLGGSNDVISTDGGALASVYEKGSALGLEPLDYGDPTLVGYWPLNEGTGTVAYDYSGNNATGTWHGTLAGTNGYYSAGKSGGWAGYFNGSNDFVNVSSTSALGLTNMTILLWVNSSNSSQTNANLLGKPDTGTSANVNYQFWLGSNGSDARFYTGNGSTFQDIEVTNALSNSNWHQWAVSVNGSQLLSYIDGQKVGSLAQTITPASNSSPLQIGGGATYYYNGSISNLRIYNRVLSAAQIAALYAGGK